MIVLSNLGAVTRIRYIAPGGPQAADRRLTFQAMSILEWSSDATGDQGLAWT